MHTKRYKRDNIRDWQSINFIYFQQTNFFLLAFHPAREKKNQYWVTQNEYAESSCMATKLWTVCVCVERQEKNDNNFVECEFFKSVPKWN